MKLEFYTTQQIGPKRHKTPEGWLVCQDVAIARTGEMRYLGTEVPVAAGPDGTVIIQREPEEVFRPETIASAMGKDVVDDHPEVDVDTSNWRNLSMGVVVNPRRGLGDEADLLFADLIIKDPRAIQLVDDGKREVSCGYDAQYDELAPGLGRQRDIVINHVALVERGRCGPRCSINDHQKEPLMRTTDEKKVTAWGRLRAVLLKGTTADRDVIAKALDEAEKEDEDEKKDSKDAEGGSALHLHLPGGEGSGKVAGGDEEMPAWFKKHAEASDKRFGDIEGNMGKMLEKWAKEEGEEPEHQDDQAVLSGALKGEVPEGTTGDAIKKMKDSALMQDSFAETIAGAEILVPGIKMPTFDAKAKPRATFDAICGLRRQALVVAATQGGPVADMISAAKFDFGKSTCDSVRTVFATAVTAKKVMNNVGTTADKTQLGNVNTGVIKTLADLNRRNAEIWKKK